MGPCFAQRHDTDTSPTAFTVPGLGCCTVDDTTEEARCGSDHDYACVANAARGARDVDAELRSRLDTIFSPEIPEASLRAEGDELPPPTPPLRHSRVPRACTPPRTAAPTQIQSSIKVRHRLAKRQRRPTCSLSVVNRAPLIALFDNC